MYNSYYGYWFFPLIKQYFCLCFTSVVCLPELLFLVCLFAAVFLSHLFSFCQCAAAPSVLLLLLGCTLSNVLRYSFLGLR